MPERTERTERTERRPLGHETFVRPRGRRLSLSGSKAR